MTQCGMCRAENCPDGTALGCTCACHAGEPSLLERGLGSVLEAGDRIRELESNVNDLVRLASGYEARAKAAEELVAKYKPFYDLYFK